jgi:hypothetical protein
MEHVFKHEQIPTGKVIIRHFDGNGSLIEETHAYGALDIGFAYLFRGGVKIEETYFCTRRLVSRRTYEKARTRYTDMPAAEGTLEDSGSQLLKAVAKERRQRNTQAKQHRPDPDEARKNDAFCSTVMNKGKREEAVQWIRTRDHTLGERDWSNSKRLVDRLSAHGCVHIYACEIDTYEESFENAGYLVVELPPGAASRSKILKFIGRLAGEEGYNGPFDNGQKYAYVKLD